MAKFQQVIDIIRNFFNPPVTLQENSRKRRAIDSVDNLLSPKRLRSPISKDCSPISKDFLDFDRENYFRTPLPHRRNTIYKLNKNMDTIVLDDEDDGIVDIRRFSGNGTQNSHKNSKFTSTPYDSAKKTTLNGCDDELTFVKEFKSPSARKSEAAKKGLNYIKPFSSSGIFRPRTVQAERQLKQTCNNSTLNGSSKNLNNSIRLDDKMQYKKLLESSNESSIYSTPMGTIFNYDTTNRRDRIMAAALKSPNDGSKERMSTKDTIRKVLKDLKNEPVLVKDSDSDSDVILVNPPSPKPDIKVDPVNSLKTVVDTAEQSKPEWLKNLVNRHLKLIAERQKEIDYLAEFSKKHGKINNDMRLEVLSDKINKSLQIRDAVLPVEDKEEELELPLLSEAQLKMVNRAFKGDPNEILSKKFNLSITRRDILTLAGLNWLNDEVINFYMNMIIERGKDSKWPKTFAFNTFFYPKLIKDGPQSLRRWTKRVDLFEQDLICIPIHLGMHWCMAIIDFRDKSIRYYDSMGSRNDKCLRALRNYLEAEHLDKKKSQYNTSDFELENVKEIPQQMNGSDCGMFSCTFAEFVTRNAKITFSQEHMPYLRQKMVVEILSGELLMQ